MSASLSTPTAPSALDSVGAILAPASTTAVKKPKFRKCTAENWKEAGLSWAGPPPRADCPLKHAQASARKSAATAAAKKPPRFGIQPSAALTHGPQTPPRSNEASLATSAEPHGAQVPASTFGTSLAQGLNSMPPPRLTSVASPTTSPSTHQSPASTPLGPQSGGSSASFERVVPSSPLVSSPVNHGSSSPAFANDGFPSPFATINEFERSSQVTNDATPEPLEELFGQRPVKRARADSGDPLDDNDSENDDSAESGQFGRGGMDGMAGAGNGAISVTADVGQVENSDKKSPTGFMNRHQKTLDRTRSQTG